MSAAMLPKDTLAAVHALRGEIRALRNELRALAAQLQPPPPSPILTGREVTEAFKQLRGV